MYHRLRQDILARIRRGEFGPGDRLPSENQLCEHYEVSATTARRALLELVNEGVVQRKAGVGTMVASRVRQARLALVSVEYLGDAWRQISCLMGELMGGIGECAWQRNADFSTTGVETDDVANYLRDLAQMRSADGVLLRTANDVEEEYLEILEDAGIPYVVVKRQIPGRSMNCVVSNDVSGARMATEHLLSLGYRRIGFVCAKPQITLGRERQAGYREALQAWGLDVDESLVRWKADFASEAGYEAVRQLLELPQPPQAIFVASDTMALGGYKAAKELQFVIPDDVAFVGYDDIPPVSLLQPALTTVRTSYYEFGRLATELLLDIIDGEELAPQRRVIEPELIVRDSSRASSASGASQSLLEESHTPSLEYNESPDYPRGRLAGKSILRVGGGEEALRLALACEAEGAMVFGADSPEARPEGAVPAPPKKAAGGIETVLAAHGRPDILLYTLDSHQMITGLQQAALEGRAVALRMSERGQGGQVVFVAPWKHCDETAAVERAAFQAGLERVVETLAREWSAGSVRVNAIVFEASRADKDRSHAGPTIFLASEESAAVSGHTLVLS